MATRVRSIDVGALTAAQFSQGVDYPLVQKNRRLAQLSAITLPASAAGLLGVRVGSDGDALRLNSQGQPINLDGADQTAGVWLVWMGSGASTPTGTVEFAFGFLDEGQK
jgi:hypothetical protein